MPDPVIEDIVRSPRGDLLTGHNWRGAIFDGAGRGGTPVRHPFRGA